MAFRKSAVWLAAGALAFGLGALRATGHAAMSSPAGPQPSTPVSELLRYPPNAPQLASIRVAAVRRGPMPVAHVIYGRVVYDEDATARVTSAVVGRTVAVRRKLGDRVAQGAVLALLDSPDVATARSDYLKATADEQRKRETLARVAELLASDTAPRKDVEVAQADVLMASAETARAAQKLHNLGVDAEPGDRSVTGRLSLRTPIAGTVVDRQMNEGMEVRPDLANPLFTVTDPERLWVMADVPDNVVPQIRIGQAVNIDSDAWPGLDFRGTVDAIPSAVDATSRRLQVRCRVRSPGGRLKAEMLVHLNFLGDHRRDAVEVPNAALVLQGNRQLVIVQTAPGVFARREVEVGMAGPDTTFVVAGLVDGDKVVTEGALLLLGEFPAHAR